jgi:hypothetical protein
MKLPKALHAIHQDESQQTFNLPRQRDDWGQQEVTLIATFSLQQKLLNTPNQTMTTSPPQIHYHPWGHDIKSPKPNNTRRLYYKNTNGIGTRAFTNGLTTLYQHHKATRQWKAASPFTLKPIQIGNNQPLNTSTKLIANNCITMQSLPTQHRTHQRNSGTSLEGLCLHPPEQ